MEIVGGGSVIDRAYLVSSQPKFKIQGGSTSIMDGDQTKDGWTEILLFNIDAVPFRSHHTMTRVSLLLVGLFVGLIVSLFVCYFLRSWCSSVPVRSLHALMFVSSYLISL